MLYLQIRKLFYRCNSLKFDRSWMSLIIITSLNSIVGYPNSKLGSGTQLPDRALPRVPISRKNYRNCLIDGWYWNNMKNVYFNFRRCNCVVETVTRLEWSTVSNLAYVSSSYLSYLFIAFSSINAGVHYISYSFLLAWVRGDIMVHNIRALWDVFRYRDGVQCLWLFMVIISLLAWWQKMN